MIGILFDRMPIESPIILVYDFSGDMAYFRQNEKQNAENVTLLKGAVVAKDYFVDNKQHAIYVYKYFLSRVHTIIQ